MTHKTDDQRRAAWKLSIKHIKFYLFLKYHYVYALADRKECSKHIKKEKYCKTKVSIEIYI